MTRVQVGVGSRAGAALVVGCLTVGLGAAHAAPGTGAIADDLAPPGAGPLSGGTRGYVAAPPEAFTSAAGQPISPLIYLNRCRGGCTFTVSTVSDARTNLTIVGAFALGTHFTISEFALGDALWDQVVACVREVYQPFGVQIVTEDPGNVAHHEAVVAGRGLEINQPESLGVAPLSASTCQPQDNVISFTFANAHVADANAVCWTVAQESAHAFGLDHHFECTDAMTYIPDSCGRKFFRNLDSPCGEFGPRDCVCGGTIQNSYRHLLGVHGPGTAPVPPPTVDVRAPADGATGLPRGFTVLATAIDPRHLHHLELWINGWRWQVVEGADQPTPIMIGVPATVPDGVMDVEVRACGDTGVCAADHVTVTQGAPCTSAASCLPGQQCEAGRCFWDPPTLDIGEPCEYAQQCVSPTASCAAVGGGEPICTEPCVSGPNDRCPEGFACVAPALGAPGQCGPVATDGGCCSTGDRGGRAVLADLGLAVGLGLLVARRRRRARA